MNRYLTFTLITALTVFTYTVQAQTCYSFDNYIQDTATKEHAFAAYGNGNGGALNDWHVTSGTPSVYRSGWMLGQPAYDGNQYAVMGVCDVAQNSSEGLSLTYDFRQGQSYKVTMALRNVPITGSTTANPIDVKLVLLQNGINYTYNFNTGCSTTPGIPTGALVADSLMNFDQYNWQVYTFNLTNLPSDFSQLWIRAEFSSGSPWITSFLCLDSICVQQLSPSNCYSFDDYQVPPADYQQAFDIYGNGHPGFLQDWHVPSGTPNIYASGSIPGVNAYSGDQYAMMGICDAGAGMSEGLEVAYPFLQGQAYTVSMAVRNIPYPGNSSTPIDVKFILLNDTISYTYNSHTGCSQTPSIPANGLVVDSMANYDQDAWQVLSFNTPVLSSNYKQLWIRGEFSSGSPLITTLFSLDSVCIKPYIAPAAPPTTNCYSFDDVTVPSYNQQQAFNIYGNGHVGFLHDWHVPSGTPNIEPSGGIAGVDAYDGNQYAMMGICNSGYDQSEGLELAYPFQQGQTYQVSMAIRNVPITGSQSTPIDVKFILLTDTINYSYNANTGCSTTPAIPTNALTVDSNITNYSQNIWKNYSFNISNLPRDYKQLWIRAVFSNGAPLETTAFCIDSICIKPFDMYVWPGDANNDGVADNYDIFALGQGYNDGGNNRITQSIIWSPQFSNNWTNSVPGGENEKYADCNGDGAVNADDTLAITQNYGESHSKSSVIGNSSSPRLYINLPANYIVQPGHTLQVPIYLGTDSKSVNAIYGVAFSMEYDTNYIVKKTETLSTTGSWMGTRGNNLLTFSKDLYHTGRTDVTLTRTDKTNIAGYGQIGSLSYVMKDDVTGKGDIIRNLLLSISRVRAITYDGTELPLNFGGIDTVKVTVTGVEETPQPMPVACLPKPCQQLPDNRWQQQPNDPIHNYGYSGQ